MSASQLPQAQLAPPLPVEKSLWQKHWPVIVALALFGVLSFSCGSFVTYLFVKSPRQDPQEEVGDQPKGGAAGKKVIAIDPAKVANPLAGIIPKPKKILHTDIVDFDGIRIEVISGEIGNHTYQVSKIGVFKPTETATILQAKIKFRISNATKGRVFSFLALTGAVKDEFDNLVPWPQVIADKGKEKLDPGESMDVVLSFGVPFKGAKEFRIEIPAMFFRRDTSLESVSIHVPRSFLAEKK